MSTTTPNPDAGPGHVPGWATVGEDELEHPDELPSDEGQTPPPATPDRPSSGPSPTSPFEGERGTDHAASSTPGSPLIDDDDPSASGEEINTYVEAELEELGAAAFDVAGRALNRVYRRRTQTDTRLWLATQDEAEAFGAAAARVMARHLPDELTEDDSDAADALVMGSVALGYVLRNTAGVEAPGPAAAAAEDYTPPADTSGAAAPPATAQAPPPPVLTPDL